MIDERLSVAICKPFGEPGCDLSWFALKLLLFESVDEFDGGERPAALPFLAPPNDIRGAIPLFYSVPPDILQ
jgi:hypothetical protein